MTEIISALAKKTAANAQIGPDDYEKDGLWHCGACRNPKQRYVTLPMRQKQIKVFCLCKCATERRDKEWAEEQERKEMDRLKKDA